MMLRSALLATLVSLPLVARAQEQVADATAAQSDAKSAKDLFAEFETKAQAAKDPKEVATIAKDLLDANKDAFSTGDGLHYGGKLSLMSGDVAAAAAAFKKHIEDNPTSEMADDSRVFAALCLMRSDDLDGAGALIEKIDDSKLSADTQGLAKSLKRSIGAERDRAQMNGKTAPEIASSTVVNGDAAEFKLSGLKVKVVVVDFFATWCPPCRMVIPELVDLQAKRGADGVQVIGATQFYGYGMDFSDPKATKPHGGKSVGGREGDALTKDVELEVNKTFAKAFEMNYPIVFADADVIGKAYGVQGIPTVFVIDKEGKIVGSVVGSGEPNHEKILAMVEKALGGVKAGAGSKHGGK